MKPTARTSTGLVALRRLTWWGTLVCLAFIVALAVAESLSVRPAAVRLLLVATVLGVCAVAARYFAVAVQDARPPGWWLAAGAALAGAGMLALSRVAAEGGFPWVLPVAALIAAVCAGVDRSWRWVLPAGAAMTGVASAIGSAEGSWTVPATNAALAVVCALGLYSQVWVLRVVQRLDRAHHLERAAALAEERLRFAADLHDIQGHSLQVIALKSELAERLAGADPARAVAEMRDVQALARQALGDTREVVRGYRAVSLDTEIANAVRVLNAAGIESTCERSGAPQLSPATENLLGLVVRECTTNVLRHSAARHCAVSLGSGPDGVRLRFSNDGPLGETAAPGGLAVLADRLAAAGGRLDRSRTDTEFAVSAHLPAEAQ
ncbi:sensor histidine kinase [Actinoplanes sp. NPDC049668]|uniref:sensor histidine kinase n=1 Tax=unclassified Actinoplanes TaxID=2626549 RepID=UPI0033B7C69D